MKRTNLTADMIKQMMARRSELELVRVHYCYQLGSTFVNLALMENTIIDAMAMCDRIKVEGLLGRDVKAWERLQHKTETLKSSTLGNLISILAKHDVSGADLAYLRWVKAKRDFFIHRFFDAHQWPGELDEKAITTMCRRLLYLEAIFSRASHRIWRVFGNAGLLRYVDLGKNGALMMNPDLFGDLSS